MSVSRYNVHRAHKCADLIGIGGMKLDKRVEMSWLLDFYGPLLTARRAAVARSYYEEDLSLSEIADEQGITRQGVHDAIRNIESQLRAYEARLGLLARYRRIEEEVSRCRACLMQVEPVSGSEGALQSALLALSNIASDP